MSYNGPYACTCTPTMIAERRRCEGCIAEDSDARGWLRDASPMPPAPVSPGEATPPTDDEMAEHFIDANERMGEAITAIGMALGLPRPRTGATWGAPEILRKVDQLREDVDMLRRWSAESPRRDIECTNPGCGRRYSVSIADHEISEAVEIPPPYTEGVEHQEITLRVGSGQVTAKQAVARLVSHGHDLTDRAALDYTTAELRHRSRQYGRASDTIGGLRHRVAKLEADRRGWISHARAAAGSPVAEKTPSFAAVQDRVRDAIDALPDVDRNPPELAYAATTAVMPLLAEHPGVARPELVCSDDLLGTLDLWALDRRASIERREVVRDVWPELGMRLDDLAEQARTATATEET